MSELEILKKVREYFEEKLYSVFKPDRIELESENEAYKIYKVYEGEDAFCYEVLYYKELNTVYLKYWFKIA